MKIIGGPLFMFPLLYNKNVEIRVNDLALEHMLGMHSWDQTPIPPGLCTPPVASMGKKVKVKFEHLTIDFLHFFAYLEALYSYRTWIVVCGNRSLLASFILYLTLDLNVIDRIGVTSWDHEK